MEARTARRALEQSNQSGGIPIWQRPNQRRIHKRKNGHAGANPKGERHDCRRGEAGVPPQLPQRELQILKNSFHPKSHYLVALLLQSRRIAELPLRRIACRLRLHAFGHKLLLRRGAMKLHLLGQLIAKSLASEEELQFAQKTQHRGLTHPAARGRSLRSSAGTRIAPRPVVSFPPPSAYRNALAGW